MNTNLRVGKLYQIEKGHHWWHNIYTEGERTHVTEDQLLVLLEFGPPLRQEYFSTGMLRVRMLCPDGVIITIPYIWSWRLRPAKAE